MTNDLPALLKQDTIVESYLEIRFEHNQVGEIVLGRLAAVSDWNGYQSQRLPFSDLPQSIRDSDINLRFEPILQLQDPRGQEVVKIGPRVLSLHRLGGYPGWSKFFDRQKGMISGLWATVPGLEIARIGLRYINALLPSHGFNSFWDMNLKVEVDGDRPAETMAANYRFPAGVNCMVQVGVAHPTYVNGPLIPGSVALVDIDVFTPQQVGSTTEQIVLQWVEDAHKAEKQAFFKLWPEDKLNAQRVK